MIMKWTWLFFLSLLEVIPSGKAQSQETAVHLHGRLRVERGEIVDQHGEPPQLRGVSFSWSIWQGQKYYKPRVLDWLVKDFKVSVVRLAMAVEPAGGYLERPDFQTQLITEMADQAIKKGVYFILDWHDHHASLHQEQAKSFFKKTAARYAKVSNVIYEVWNEPEHQNWDEVKKYAIGIIKAIREYDPHNLIVVGSPHWDQDVDIAADDPITEFENVAYSFHFYASDPGHQQSLMEKANYAKSRRLPLMVTEWGVGEADGDGEFSKEKTERWLRWLEENKMSWVNWNITDKKETTALLLPGASVRGGWTVVQLSEAGKYIRSVLRDVRNGKR